MKLAQAKPVCVLYHHHRGVGHIHADFYDGGRDQDLRLPLGKIPHDGLFLRAFHPAVQEADLQFREHTLLQRFCPDLGGLAGFGFPLFHTGTDDVALMPRLDLPAEESIQAGPMRLIHQKRVHCLPSWRQLVQDGNIQISV